MFTSVAESSAPAASAPKVRHHWMDLLRGIAVVMVIVLHLEILQQIWDGETPSALVAISAAAGPFRMPMLMFVSGMMLPRSLNKPAGRYLDGKARSLLWPWAVWSVILAATQTFESSADPLWWVNGMYTWFLMALFVYYVAALVGRRVPKGWFVIASIVAWTALPFLGAIPDYDGPRPDRFVFYAAFFFAGAALSKVLLAGRVPWALTVPAIAVVIAWAGYAVHLGHDPRLPVISQLAVIIGVIGAIGVAQRLPRLAPVRALEWMGRSSIVMYVVHLPVLEILTRYLPLPDGLPGALILGGTTLGVCVLAVHLRPRMPWLYAFPEGIRLPSLRRAVPVNG